MTDADLNALDFAFLSRPEFYIPSVLSFIGLTILYFMTFHLLMPLVVNPNFEHIQKSEKLQFKIATSIIGLVNGLCIGYVSLIWLYDIVAFTITEQNASAETTKAQRVWLSIGIGYFCYDIVVFCVVGSLRYIGRVDKVYIVHHSLCILIWGLSIISVYGGQVSMIVIWLHEWTNPLLAAILFQSYFTRNRKEYSALRMQFMLKLSYFVTFNVMRFGFGLQISKQLLVEFESPRYLQISVPLLILLNGIFSVVLFKDLCKVYRAMGKAQNAKVAAKEI